MPIPRGLIVGAGCAITVALAVLFLAPASAEVSNTSRVDAGPPIEVRINEGFDVAPGGYFEDPPAVETREFYWDLDNRTDTIPHDGIPTNDQDQFQLAFHFDGFDRVGTWTFTLWINYSDGRLANGSRLITVVENQPPVITPGLAPTGVTGDAVSFAVTVSDPDSVESTLLYFWDFDVGFDSSGDGVLDNDVDSTSSSNVAYIYNAEGTYTAKLTVRDDFGAETEAFITAVVQKPPGVCQREVLATSVGQAFSENVTIRKLCWASYHIKVTAGRLYSYTIEVSNGIPVYVMVQFGKEQYDTYKVRGSTQAYEPAWSTVPDKVTSVTKQFRPTEDGTAYVTVDNGWLFQSDPGREAIVVVTVQDVDRNNLLANIPWYAWVVAGAGIIGVVAFLAGRAFLAGAEVRRVDREKRAVEQQEKVSAKSELQQFLSNPDAAMQRKTAPPPPPPPPLGAVAPPAAFAPSPQARGPAPRPAGPQPPAGYVAPAAAPPPPPPPSAPYGPAPATGPQPPPPAVPTMCANCATPTEVGWHICPNCGAGL